jgi:hypothetical protein
MEHTVEVEAGPLHEAVASSVTDFREDLLLK